VNVRRSERCGAVRPENNPCSTAALGAGSWRTVSSSTLAAHGTRRSGTRRASRDTTFITGSPTVSATSSGVNATAQASSALSSTGISTTMPRSRSGASDATSSVVLAPSDVPPTTASSTPRWSSSPMTSCAKMPML
jgi:hypothetical protein